MTTPTQRAWLQRAFQLACAMPHVKPYSKAATLKQLDELHALTVSEHEVRKVPQVLANMGIRFVVVEPLPRSKMDGATMWLGEQPIIAVSLRYDRIDGFWHTLSHEMIHVLNNEGSVDDDLVNTEKIGSSDRSEEEKRADDEGSNFLVPRDKLNSFIMRNQPRFSKTKIIQFANFHQIHPGIVVGQLQHRDAIKYHHSREMLVPVRSILTETATTDGWGHFPNI